MPEWLQYFGSGFVCGLVLGQLLTRWVIWGYVSGKVPDEIGHRTGLWVKGEMYYLVTGPEYVEGVLKLRPSMKPRASAEWRP